MPRVRSDKRTQAQPFQERLPYLLLWPGPFFGPDPLSPLAITRRRSAARLKSMPSMLSPACSRVAATVGRAVSDVSMAYESNRLLAASMRITRREAIHVLMFG